MRWARLRGDAGAALAVRGTLLVASAVTAARAPRERAAHGGLDGKPTPVGRRRCKPPDPEPPKAAEGDARVGASRPPPLRGPARQRHLGPATREAPLPLGQDRVWGVRECRPRLEGATFAGWTRDVDAPEGRGWLTWTLALLVSWVQLGCVGDGYTGLEGSVRTSQGTPIEGVQIALRSDRKTYAHAASDREGAYSVSAIHAPFRFPLIVELSKPGYETQTKRLAAGNGLRRLDFELKSAPEARPGVVDGIR